MSIILSHSTGNANVRAVAAGLLHAEMMTSFHTTVATFEGQLLDRLSSFGPLAEIRRRRFDQSLREFTKSWPSRETGRLLASKAGLSGLIHHETGLFSVDAVIRSLDRHTASAIRQVDNQETTGVYAYEDGAALSFHEAHKKGIKCLYDLPIGYWRTAQRLLKRERELWPDWASTLTSFKDSRAKLIRKDEEIALADHIFVASQFTADTLTDYPGQLPPVHIVPYGFPTTFDHRQYPKVAHGRPLNLLFVGGLSQRKGIANLFAAVESFKSRVQLTVVGQKAGASCMALDKALSKHRWIPSLPHHSIIELMRTQDILVFPSLFEGFGLVITEAMSQGTPVITTERTAGPDLIKHNENGWIVEAGSTQALKQTIDQLLQQPVRIAEAGRAAVDTARMRPWSVYGHELAAVIAGISNY